MENENNKYTQSAVIPFKINNGKLKILLIKSRNNKWIFPKGIIENGLTPQESARREAVEEAGIDGFVYEKLLGEYEYEKWGGICHVKVYPMNVNKEFETWEEDYFRMRKWFNFDNALLKLKNDSLIRILNHLKEIIGSQ